MHDKLHLVKIFLARLSNLNGVERFGVEVFSRFSQCVTGSRQAALSLKLAYSLLNVSHVCVLKYSFE